jgi:hypothetical protein
MTSDTACSSLARSRQLPHCCCTRTGKRRIHARNRSLTCGGAKGARTPDLLVANHISCVFLRRLASADELSTCGDCCRLSVGVAWTLAPLALCLALLGPSFWPLSTRGDWARTVELLMRQAGIKSLLGLADLGRSTRRSLREPDASPVLGRAPDQLWVTDTTEHPTPGGMVYCTSSWMPGRAGWWRVYQQLADSGLVTSALDLGGHP